MKTRNYVSASLIVFFSIILASYTFGPSNFFSNCLFLLTPIIAVLFGIYAISTYRLSNDHGKVMALLTTGILFWLIGESIFFLFQFAWHISPYPSVADIFYLIGYPLILMGLAKEIMIHKVDLRNLNKLFLTLIVLLITVLAIIVSYFGIYRSYSTDDSFLGNAISIAYGIGDLILIAPGLFVLKIAMDYRGGKLYNSWMLVLFALLCMLSGDILFAIFSDQYTDLIWPYTLIDIAYVLSYLLFGYSFFYTATTIKDLHAKLKR